MNYRRKTVSGDVFINNKDTGTLYTTDKDSSHTGGFEGSEGGYERNISDTMRWIGSIGPIYYASDERYMNSAIFDVNYQLIEQYSLIAFNGKTVIVTPVTINVKSPVCTAPRNTSRAFYGKAVRLYDNWRSFTGIGAYRSDLLGRSVRRLSGTQLFILPVECDGYRSV